MNKKIEKKLFFVDPQSYNNLSIYDYGVLKEINEFDIWYFCNKKYDYLPLNNIITKKIFSYSRYRNNFLKCLSYLKSLFFLLIEIIKERPDIIHIQWLRIPKIEIPLYYILRKIFRTKIVFTVHNIFPRNCSENTKKLYTKFYKNCNALIVHTETSKKNLISKVPVLKESIHVIDHGLIEIKVNKEDVDKTIKKIKSEYSLQNKTILLHIGGQTKYKGSDILLETWLSNSSISTDDSICLIQAGKNYDLEIPDRLPDNLILISRLLSDVEFVALLHLSDVVLLPYREIDQSGIILTLINEEIPYCASNVGELAVPFKIADIGWEFEDISTESIAKSIIFLKNNPSEIEHKRNNKQGWIKLKQHFDWGRISKETQRVYNNLWKKK